MRTDSQELLLDTHVWIWLVRGDGRISEPVRETIFQAAGAMTLFISVMSIWEVSLLADKGRLVLNQPCLEWVTAALLRSGTEPILLTPKIAVECNSLPGRFHNDPADRIIAATARAEGLTVITRDRQILDYAAQGYVSALPC
ncbi:MAG TPA: type II toxin-antitoxin system VapC family toxin [Geminicoccaceae bacterium]|jgi:PIN domain nuclease of toxin-antitoxin system|nr:type II toxin-antitoxin system VapC family toxin [Geminicoccaceae bacterium]